MATNYEKLTKSTREQLVEFFRARCGNGCPCYEYCHVTTNDDCRETIGRWLDMEDPDDAGTS